MKRISTAPNGECILTAVKKDSIATLHANGIYGIEETALHLRAIPFIGAAWGIPESEVNAALDAITDAKNYVTSEISDCDMTAKDEHLPLDEDNPMEMIWGLFKTATMLAELEQRAAVYELAIYIWEKNNLDSPFIIVPCA